MLIRGIYIYYCDLLIFYHSFMSVGGQKISLTILGHSSDMTFFLKIFDEEIKVNQNLILNKSPNTLWINALLLRYIPRHSVEQR